VSLPVLARLWQMLLKGLGELQAAPNPAQAMEMILIRLAYAADLPVPADLVRALGPAPTAPVASGAPPMPTKSSGDRVAAAAECPSTPGAPAPMPQSFAEVVALFDERREAVLSAQLKEYAHPVSFEPGRFEFRPAAGAPPDLANRLGRLLGEWTGTRWLVAVSEAAGEPTLRQQRDSREQDRREAIVSHPLVRAVFETFPGAAISAVRERFAGARPQPDNAEGNEAGSEEDET
jgi:DNA polymerase-3 subunit gamma/tau